MSRRWYDPLTGAPGQGDPDGAATSDVLQTGGKQRRSDLPVVAGSVIDQLVDRRNWRHRLKGASIHQVWDAVAGEAVAQHVRPVRLYGGVLVLEADSGAWATQVRYLQQRLIERANEELGSPLVERIQIRSAGKKR